jgi:hypothetical protein
MQQAKLPNVLMPITRPCGPTASAPLKELDRDFGFEPEHVVAMAMELLGPN